MKVLALALLLAAPAVQAQMYKCVDERGKTVYADKPIPNCKQGKVVAPPPSVAAPARSASAVAKTGRPPPLTPEQAEHERRYANSRCKTLREEEEWLLSPRGKAIEAYEARLGQVRQALQGCR